MANRNFPNKGNLYSSHAKPVTIDCSFIVDSTNGNGLGLRSLKSAGMIKSVYMNTSATPAAGNPNPAAGIIQVRFADNYRRYVSGTSGFVGPTATSSTSTVTNVINVISVLGTATTAQWVAVGLPIGVTPAVGAAFIATSSAVIGGSAQTILASATGAGIDHIEVVGDPNLTISPNPASANGIGGYIYLRCYEGTTLTAPNAGTVVGLTFTFDDSSVLPGSGG